MENFDPLSSMGQGSLEETEALMKMIGDSEKIDNKEVSKNDKTSVEGKKLESEILSDSSLPKSTEKQQNIKRISSDKLSYNALELFKFENPDIPKLLNPFLQTVGLASLVGTSDSGKSTFLRQLALSIVLDLPDFLGFELNATHKRVLYVSTEDDPYSVSSSIRKQIIHLQKEYSISELEGLKNLDFMFNTDKLYEEINNKLEKEPVDLIVVDAFTDVFIKELNANTQVRNFLNGYDKIAKKHQCLIIFLHHIGKNLMHKAPSKDSIIGSQGFEAKMRVVLELRPQNKNNYQIDLWVLKANFLEAKYKNLSYKLNFNPNLVFSNTGERGVKKDTKKIQPKSSNPELIKKVLDLHKKGLSARKIEEQLKDTELKVSKTVAAEIIKKNKTL